MDNRASETSTKNSHPREKRTYKRRRSSSSDSDSMTEEENLKESISILKRANKQLYKGNRLVDIPRLYHSKENAELRDLRKDLVNIYQDQADERNKELKKRFDEAIPISLRDFAYFVFYSVYYIKKTNQVAEITRKGFCFKCLSFVLKENIKNETHFFDAQGIFPQIYENLDEKVKLDHEMLSSLRINLEIRRNIYFWYHLPFLLDAIEELGKFIGGWSNFVFSQNSKYPTCINDSSDGKFKRDTYLRLEDETIKNFAEEKDLLSEKAEKIIKNFRKDPMDLRKINKVKYLSDYIRENRDQYPSNNRRGDSDSYYNNRNNNYRSDNRRYNNRDSRSGYNNKRTSYYNSRNNGGYSRSSRDRDYEPRTFTEQKDRSFRKASEISEKSGTGQNDDNGSKMQLENFRKNSSSNNSGLLNSKFRKIEKLAEKDEKIYNEINEFFDDILKR